MHMEPQALTIDVNGKELIFETGKIAKQANGSVTLRIGDTVLFASACAKSEPGEEMDFFPLRIDYQEKFSSVGKTLSGFIKREGRPSERETLLCRLIDRPLRPLFDSAFTREVQLILTLLSYNPDVDAEIPALIAASSAVKLSGLPFNGTLGAVKVGYDGEKYLLNPSVRVYLYLKLTCLN